MRESPADNTIAIGLSLLVHVLLFGLILLGDDVRVVWADGVRQRRSDRVELEPLLACGPLEVYSSRAWDEAAWPLATRGYTRVRSAIPKLTSSAG